LKPNPQISDEFCITVALTSLRARSQSFWKPEPLQNLATSLPSQIQQTQLSNKKNEILNEIQTDELMHKNSERRLKKAPFRCPWSRTTVFIDRGWRGTRHLQLTSGQGKEGPGMVGSATCCLRWGRSAAPGTSGGRRERRSSICVPMRYPGVPMEGIWEMIEDRQCGRLGVLTSWGVLIGYSTCVLGHQYSCSRPDLHCLVMIFDQLYADAWSIWGLTWRYCRKV